MRLSRLRWRLRKSLNLSAQPWSPALLVLSPPPWGTFPALHPALPQPWMTSLAWGKTQPLWMGLTLLISSQRLDRPLAVWRVNLRVPLCSWTPRSWPL